MRLSNKVDYGIRALLDLSVHQAAGLVPIADIAGRTNIPLKFLEQILLALKAAGMVDSKRGVGGGYFLARAPQAITVADAVKALDGPIGPAACASELSGGCVERDICGIRSVWAEAGSAMERVLSRTSFADLALLSKSQAAEREARGMYYI